MTRDRNTAALFVEGSDDGSVVNKVAAKRLGLDIAHKPSSRIVRSEPEHGGFEWALSQFIIALGQGKLERVGHLVDRDGLDNKPDRWLAVRDALRKAGIPVADGTLPEGLVARHGPQIVGVWLLPDNVAFGDLETLLERLVPPQAPDWSYADDAAKEAKNKQSPFKPVHRRKARLHSWLAWRDEPGPPYGTAIEKGDFDAGVAALDGFVAWFERLFVDPMA